MEYEINEQLLIIARKLSKDTKEFNHYYELIIKNNFEQNADLAIEFLLKSINTNTYNQISKCYKRLFSLFFVYQKEAAKVSNFSEFYKIIKNMKGLMCSSGLLPSYKLIKPSKYYVMIPEKQLESLLEKAYDEGFETYYSYEKKWLHCDFKSEYASHAISFLKDFIEVIPYSIDEEGNIFLKVYSSENEEDLSKEVIIPKEEVRIKYKKSKGGIREETKEELCATAILEGGINSFLQIMLLKNKVDFNKVSVIITNKKNRKEVKENGLSKTSELTIS